MISATFSQLGQLTFGVALGIAVAAYIGRYKLPKWKENLLLLASIAVYIGVTQFLVHD